MRIAIFQYDAGMGGIQKSLRNLLTSDILDEHMVDLYLFQEGHYGNWNIDKDQVKVHKLPALSRLCRFIPFSLLARFCRAYRNWDTEYDLAIDFNSYQPDCALAALRCPAKRKVEWIHNNVYEVWKNEPKFRVLWHFMKGKFARFDEFVGVSEGVVEPFCSMTKIRDKKIYVIPNCIDVTEIRQLSEAASLEYFDPGKIHFVTAGRLCYQKGFDLLLEAFSGACAKRPELELWMLGDGPSRSKLAALSERLGIQEKVHLVGATENPYRFMAQADAFVLCSRYEGQGMVLWEAKAVGIPILFPRHLEQYNPGLKGVEDMENALIEFERQKRTPDDLGIYEEKIREEMEQFLIE